jgi:trimeric autotransporter adhesin
LNGLYVRASDSCGITSLAADASGNFNFSSPGGDSDCTTPGFGGAGNTSASRTLFYNLNRAKEVARGWLPGNEWLDSQLTGNVNMNATCNAFWNGITVNFYRSGDGCYNTGELESVLLHEYGHGLDANDGNFDFTDNGTGETYGDFTAALITHRSCIGAGIRLTTNCGGYGNACTSCNGLRDIDWGKHTSNTPHTVANFTQTHCPTHATYLGPCGREGHCESYVSSEALWDLAVRDLPGPGGTDGPNGAAAWAVAGRLWYLSRSTATEAFTCNPSGTWTSDGCNTGSLWRTLRAVDDDDGNLSNGTPHGGALFAAFNRHGIACTTDAGANTTSRGCVQPAVPNLTVAGGNNSVTVTWTSSSTGVVYDIYRNERDCNTGFIKIADDVSAPRSTTTPWPTASDTTTRSWRNPPATRPAQPTPRPAGPPTRAYRPPRA